MADIIMPKMGDAMDEGKIVQWLKNVGDAVKLGEGVAEIETDKSNVEIPAEAAGFLIEIKAQAGEVVPVGNVIAIVGAEAGAAKAAPATTAPAPKPAETPAPVATPAAAPTNTNGTAPAPVAAPVAAPAPTPVVVTSGGVFKPYGDTFVGALPEGLGGSSSLLGEPIVIAGSTERVKATPVARAMAEAHQLDLAGLKGTGPDGSVSKKDVEAALATAPALAPVAKPAETSTADTVVEYNAMRRTIARRLTESKQTIPHFYVTSEIDMEEYLALRETINAGGSKISVTDLLIKAVASALVENPVVNSSFSDNKRIVKGSVNIGIAVSIEDGLIVPVVKGCESKSVRAIAKETRPLIEKARENKLKPDEYTGGTFTISNLGQYDVENFAAIINPGEGAILAVSSIRSVPAVVADVVVPRKRMKVTLCADHRVMDGVVGALFLQSLKRLIENPLQILV